MMLIGSAIVHLAIQPIDGSDIALFVYIYEQTSNGVLRYITEGQVKASHQIVSETKPEIIGSDIPFTRSFKKIDSFSLTGESLIKLSLEPIAHTFGAGSR